MTKQGQWQLIIAALLAVSQFAQVHILASVAGHLSSHPEWALGVAYYAASMFGMIAMVMLVIYAVITGTIGWQAVAKDGRAPK